MTRTERAADDADDTLQTVEAKIEENFKSEENLILDPWSQEFDEICQKAVAFANSKAERLRKHKKRVAAAKAKRCANPTAFLHTVQCSPGWKSWRN